jgi:ubiquitin-like domain-containing CTD phosphatase 1
VYDDFDVAYGSQAEPARTAPCEDKRNKRKIKERCEKIPITVCDPSEILASSLTVAKVINEPRPGKKLLVLDLDYSQYINDSDTIYTDTPQPSSILSRC